MSQMLITATHHSTLFLPSEPANIVTDMQDITRPQGLLHGFIVMPVLGGELKTGGDRVERQLLGMVKSSQLVSR